jgi:glucose/arabinose dehydrogenase
VLWPGITTPAAQSDPPCVPGVRWLFRPPELTFDDDGALYIAMPAANQIRRLPSDGRGGFGPAQTFAADLPEPPLGLSYDAATDAFFISTDRMLLRLERQGGALTVLVDDLPGGAGGWLGNVRVGPDRRLYVAKGASGDGADERRGALLSYALDGTDERIVLRNLPDAFDMAWAADGTLYIAGSGAGDTLPTLYAIRADGAARAVRTFPAQSGPMGMVFYDDAAFPALRGGLLLALGGSWNAPEIAGYEIVHLTLSEPVTARRWLPESARSTSDASIIRTSFYPYRLTGLAVSAEGWLYAGVAEGRVYRFRPMPR